MSNEHTKQQIRKFLEKAVLKAQNPDPMDKIRREREIRAKKVQMDYGL
jgi:hypothetical protein